MRPWIPSATDRASQSSPVDLSAAVLRGRRKSLLPRPELVDRGRASPRLPFDFVKISQLRSRLVCCLALSLVFGSVPFEVRAQSSGREAELEAIRDQIMALRGRLNRVRSEASDVRSQLRATELELELQEKRVQEARAARLVAESSLAEIEGQIGDTEERLEELYALLERRLADLHRLGQRSYLRLFFSIRSAEDLLPGIRQLRYLVKRDGELLDSILQTRAVMEAQQRELVEHDATVRQWLNAESTRLAELAALRRRQEELLRRLESEDRTLSSRTERLADKERKLANLLDFLYGRSPMPLSGTPIQQFEGVLDWPVGGVVSQGFGPRLDPRYKTRVPHNGIDLDTTPGREVKIVFPGRVMFAAPFQGFGLTAVVHHPGRVFTLYAGLEDLRVRQGDMVSLGQVVGLSSEKLYFEIREENRPEDPLKWLR